MLISVTNEHALTKEAIVFGIFENRRTLEGRLQTLDGAFAGQIQEMVRKSDVPLALHSVTAIHTFGKIGEKYIFLVGLGQEKEISLKKLQETFGVLWKTLENYNIASVTIDVRSFMTKNFKEDVVSQLLGEAARMASYRTEHYKTSNEKNVKEITDIQLICQQPNIAEASFQKGLIYGDAVNSARTLVNRPSNLLTAQQLADYAKELAAAYSFEIDVLEKDDMEHLGMGGILAVNRGSAAPPKLIVLTYRGNPKSNHMLALVGKGITFDTGGYSLKTKTGIVGMKTDMGGAASVLGALQIVGERKPKRNICAVIPATDNMISGNALKPDDVITTYSGKTVEVLNTDAEGRLVLADAITYAKQLGATHIIDVATLTGGVVIALGDEVTGVMTNDEAFYEQLEKAAEFENELIWRLPLFAHFKEKVKNSAIADLNNSPGREGHAILAAAFLEEFVQGTPWIHLDIAGTVTAQAPHRLGPKGATGVMVRTLARLIESNF